MSLIIPAWLAAEYGLQEIEKEVVFRQARDAADRRGKPLLNVGCKYNFVYDSDINLDIVPRDVPNFVLGSAEDLHMFADKQFGAAFASHVLEHCNDWQRALSELYRVSDDVFAIVPKPVFLGAWFTPGHNWVFMPGPTMITRRGIDEFGIRHMDGQYLAMKRFIYAERDLREWITPNDPLVKEYSCFLWDSTPDVFVLNAWIFVCSEFSYAREIGDFWYLPSEVLHSHQRYSEVMELHSEMRLPTLPPRRPGYDCEDLAYALTSLLIAGGANAHANIGYYSTVMHAWASVTIDGREYILEPTLSKRAADIMLRDGPWMAAEDWPEYSPAYRFNHISVDHLTK